eukprot:CAMPEP_0194249212 /NCGR_PEP_ID=MMETSP0158-20130606/19922_1 /TAXON_ID=33649 /ORGANISM="Thalassionema nitzschioides, Strain L26-B" /LENGTH=872 /DNA_ID=CAMNT_0038985681 /DNA_START=214 /DNA_END=2828 /DNA_ORIENTATION=-
MSAIKTPPLTQADYRAKLNSNSMIQSNYVATLPKPGTSTPSSIHIVTKDDTTTTTTSPWITYLSPDSDNNNDSSEQNSNNLLTRQLWATNTKTGTTIQLFPPPGRQDNNIKQQKEGDFSLEEQLRRERARMMSTGVTSYSWDSQTKTMLIPFGGALWIYNKDNDDPALLNNNNSQYRKLVETNSNGADTTNPLPLHAPLLDAKISKDGSTVAFVCDKEVYVVDLMDDNENNNTTTTPKQVTSGARGVNNNGKTNGVADYIAMEELERVDGFWLSPQGSQIVYEQVDESHIPPYRITHQGEDLKKTVVGDSIDQVAKDSQVTYEEHRFPFAGAHNPKVKLGVVNTSSTTGEDDDDDDSTTLWFDLTHVFGEDFYLAKVEWLPAKDDDSDSTQLVVQLLDRRQKKLALLLLNTITGSVTTLHMETAMNDESWINLNNCFRPLPSKVGDDGSMKFLWASERDGYRHLYILQQQQDDDAAAAATEEATVVKRLTGPGEFIVEDIVALTDQYVYYMGTSEGNWLDKHLFRVTLEGDGDDDDSNNKPICLTKSILGHHDCVIKGNTLVDTVSSSQQPPLLSVFKLNEDGLLSAHTIRKIIHDAAEADPRVSALNLAQKAPTFHTFPSSDGKVTLQAALYLPDDDDNNKGGPYPLVVATYGGPHVQYVQNSWGYMTADLRCHFWTENGFAVLKVDNRGSSRRGLAFETPIYGNMGELEVADQVAGVEWAVARYNTSIDRNRVAVCGWSYGGYMALQCLLSRPDVFQAAVSGAPVTDWTLYDTAYTERYMGLPHENKEGYARSSVLHKVPEMQGSLLLCHGLLDENVLFRHSAVLINALVTAQKAYDLALFPSERHGPRRPQDRAFLEERILAFLQKSLG